MKLEKKRVLVVGMARSGIAAAELLHAIVEPEIWNAFVVCFIFIFRLEAVSVILEVSGFPLSLSSVVWQTWQILFSF